MLEHPRILKLNQSYTFDSYFELRFAPAEILADLGVKLQKTTIDLPVSPANEEQRDRIAALFDRLSESIRRTSLTSEAARREALIAPLLFEVAHLADAMINIEYPLEVNQYLKGDLDYYLQAEQHLLVVEAKNADLTRGFTQLATELIAIDQ